MIKPVGITGIGYSVPDKILTNADLEKIVDTSDEWIVERTGIRERRVAAANVSTSMLAAEAALKAIADAKLTPEEIDLIIVATATHCSAVNSCKARSTVPESPNASTGLGRTRCCVRSSANSSMMLTSMVISRFRARWRAP